MEPKTDSTCAPLSFRGRPEHLFSFNPSQPSARNHASQSKKVRWGTLKLRATSLLMRLLELPLPEVRDQCGMALQSAFTNSWFRNGLLPVHERFDHVAAPLIAPADPARPRNILTAKPHVIVKNPTS